MEPTVQISAGHRLFSNTLFAGITATKPRIVHSSSDLKGDFLCQTFKAVAKSREKARELTVSEQKFARNDAHGRVLANGARAVFTSAARLLDVWLFAVQMRVCLHL